MASGYTYVAEIDGSYETENVMHSAVLVEESVVWDQEEEKTIAYSNGIDVSGNDNTNDSYLTADEANATEYFSILESTNGEVAFGDLTLVDEEAGGIDDPAEDASEVPEVGQPVIFRVEGSEDLFAVDVTYDDRGNLQRYQYKLRANENGEYESIPESFELLPSDIPQTLPSQVPEQNDETEAPNTIEVMVKEDPGTEESLWPQVPEEVIDQMNEENSCCEHPNESFTYVMNEMQDENHGSGETAYQNAQNLEDNTVLPDVLLENVNTTHSESTESEDGSETEEFIFEDVEDDVFDRNANSESEDSVESTNPVNNQDTDTEEDVHIVNGEHVTGDAVEDARPFGMMGVQGQVLKLHQEVCQTNNAAIVIAEKTKKVPVTTYLLLSQPEKENVAHTQFIPVVPNTKLMYKVNPRSILKSSHSILKSKEEEAPAIIALPPEPPQITFRDRRFAKSKEATQQRLYNNFISTTTIVQAPVRNGKQPRKQTIMPVQRPDEEIIVQEVAVSGNGFIEATRSAMLLEEIVQVSDSDEEQDTNNKNNMMEIVISDSDDEQSNTTVSPSKRKRGRPPKKQNVVPEPSSSKKSKNDLPSIKTDWKCENCEKKFPSEGALRSHMQFHIYHEASTSLQESDSTPQASASAFKRPELPVNKYVCGVCGESFKNNVLLTRHAQMHGKNSLECPVCKKMFFNATELTVHKRTHVKQQMVLNTTPANLIPKRRLSLPKKTKSPLKKCAYCSKTFLTAILLNVHIASHKRFRCSSCSSSFVSKITLDEHIRKKCVKSPLRRRPMNMSDLTLSAAKGSQCNQCSRSFSSYTALFQHKVEVHGLETLNKCVRDIMPKGNRHRGVPPSSKFATAFAGLLSELEK